MAATYETSLVPTAVTFDAAGEAETVAFNAGTGADRVLLVHVFWRDRANVISGVTYNGVAMTALGDKVTAAAFVSGQLWRLAGPASGSNNLVVTMGAGNNSSIALISASVINTSDQSTPVDGYVSNVGSGNTAAAVSSVTVTSATGDRAAVFHAFWSDSSDRTATPTNYTERQDAANGLGYCMSFGDADGAASVATSATWTNTTDNWAWVALGVNVNAASAGASAALTGTAVGGITEADVVAGGDTIIITLTGDTWISN